jgi:hypothetical protein
MPELYDSGIFFAIILKQSKNIGLSLSYAYFRNFAFTKIAWKRLYATVLS